MFRHLTDFGYRRGGLEAVGFYLAYLLLVILLSAVMGGVAGVASPSNGFEAGVRIGTVIAMIVSLSLSFAVLTRRGLSRHPGYLVLALASAAGAWFLGGLLGVLVPAFLTTRSGGDSL